MEPDEGIIDPGRDRAIEGMGTEDLYRTLAETSPEMIYLIGSDGIVRYINSAAARMFPPKFGSVIGKHLNDIYPPDIAAGHLRAIRGVAATGRAISTELKEFFPERECWIDARLSPVRNSGGDIIAVLGLSQDITERKLVEKELRESEDRFRKVFDQGPFAMAMIGKDYRFSRANAAFCGMLGYSEEELSKLTFKEITHPEHLKADGINVDALLEGRIAVYRTEKRYLAKDGRVIWGDLTLSILRDDEGTYLQLLAIIDDITERKRLENDLTRNKALLQAIFDGTTDVIFVKDAAGRYLIFNRAAEKITGKRADEVIGKDDTFVLLPEAAAAVMANDREVLYEGRHATYEECITDAEGRKSTHSTTKGPILDETGGIIGLFGIARDITESKRTDEALQRIDKLDSLSVLAGGIAHDFNNLLGGIFGYLDLARNEAPGSPATAAYLDKALYIYDRAKALTQQLLTFSKGGDPKRKTGSLAPVVAENASFALSGSNVKCEFRLPDDLWPCDFDDNQIGQVVDNIVLNAAQAMSGGGTIIVSAENASIAKDKIHSLPAGDYVMVSFSDSGEGISPEHLGRIFDPFFTTKAGGHGLGLATSYSIIHKHGGHIDVESSPGKGSVFRIYLPASNGTVAEDPSQSAAEPKRGYGTVLVMDDEDFIREIFGKMLVSMGFGFIEAKDGDEALRILSEIAGRGESMAAVILDLTVPGGRGGKETIGEIKKIFPALPVFAASGFSEDPVMANPESSGFTDSIQKPFRRMDLERLLRARP
jgi:PAS domain S-box-containing protein